MSAPLEIYPTFNTSAPGAYAAAWKPIQEELRRRVVVQPLAPLPQFVAGADCAFSADKKTIFAVALVWDRVEQKLIETVSTKRPVTAPYIPGFLSFREGEAIAEVISKLQHPFGVVTFDGQGLAHPRRCGLATHMGVTLGVPSIGVAKSVLIGTCKDPPPTRGAQSPMMDKAEQIGVVLRTRDNVKPVYVSIGNQVDLPSAVELVLSCVTRYRIPEPTRLADIEVAKVKARG
jgi:deoxyribonuclease V